MIFGFQWLKKHFVDIWHSPIANVDMKPFTNTSKWKKLGPENRPLISINILYTYVWMWLLGMCTGMCIVHECIFFDIVIDCLSSNAIDMDK